jgi:Co/Zn/Cd efflux system component
VKDCHSCQNLLHGEPANQRHHRKTLLAVLGINTVVCAAEFWGAAEAHSHLLAADAIHLLSHVLLAILSLAAIHRDIAWKARAAIAKGGVTALLAVSALLDSGVGAISRPGILPHSGWMGAISVLALLGNFTCMWLLSRTREDDINMKSSWACSKADLISNAGLFAATALVATLGSKWPDLLIAALVTLFVLKASLAIIRESIDLLKPSPQSQMEEL